VVVAGDPAQVAQLQVQAARCASGRAQLAVVTSATSEAVCHVELQPESTLGVVRHPGHSSPIRTSATPLGKRAVVAQDPPEGVQPTTGRLA
jgi:hypothetical protein